MKEAIALTLVSSLLCISWAFPVRAETILEKVQRTGVLRVAIREDAAPLGFLNSRGKLEGYCLDFFDLLEKQLIQEIERNTLSVKLLKSTVNSRFTLIRNELVDLECGPNTINSEGREDISFSQPFFITGKQFLIDKDNRDLFDFQQDLNQVRLGLVKGTTTEEYITETYPSASMQKFSGVTAKNRGIQGVQQGKIDAMVGDGILLRAEAQQQSLSNTEYLLIPDPPLTCDRYGMIIKSKDLSWQEFINSVLSSTEATALSWEWFGESLDGQSEKYQRGGCKKIEESN